MDHIVLPQVLQSVQKLDSESSDETERESLKVIELEELIQIDAHQLERDAEMLPEYHIVLHVDDVHSVVGVILFEVLQDFQLHSCLVIVLLLVLDDLKCHHLLALVVETLDCHTETSFAKE